MIVFDISWRAADYCSSDGFRGRQQPPRRQTPCDHQVSKGPQLLRSRFSFLLPAATLVVHVPRARYPAAASAASAASAIALSVRSMVLCFSCSKAAETGTALCIACRCISSLGHQPPGDEVEIVCGLSRCSHLTSHSLFSVVRYRGFDSSTYILDWTREFSRSRKRSSPRLAEWPGIPRQDRSSAHR